LFIVICFQVAANSGHIGDLCVVTNRYTWLYIAAASGDVSRNRGRA